jgi:hypothetical protein
MDKPTSGLAGLLYLARDMLAPSSLLDKRKTNERLTGSSCTAKGAALKGHQALRGRNEKTRRSVADRERSLVERSPGCIRAN